jgi:hypothetical protein
MANTLLAALSGEQIVHSTTLATVTDNCLVIRNPDGTSHTIVALSRVTRIRTIRRTYPGFLVVASGLLLIGSGAFCSKQGAGAGPVIVSIGVVFVIAYIATRRAAVGFVSGSEVTETMFGSLREAATLVRAVQMTQAQRNESL